MTNALNKSRPAILRCFACVATIILLIAATAKSDDLSSASSDRLLLKGILTCDIALPLETVQLKAKYVHFQPKNASREVDQNNEELPSEFVIDQYGGFELDRKRQPMVLYCESADGKYAGAAQLTYDTAKTQIELKPVVAIRGRLIDLATSTPIRGERVLIGIHFDCHDRGILEGGLFGHGATTDEDGQCEFKNLIADQKYDLTRLEISKERSISLHPMGTATTTSAATVELGDVDYSRSFFATDTLPSDRLREGLKESALSHQHVVIVFSSPGDESFRRYMRLREDDQELTDAIANFRLLVVDRTGESASSALRLAKELNVDLPKNPQGTYFCFLNESGSVSQTLDVTLTSEQPFPRKELLEAAVANSPTTPDAYELLSAALKQAARENKLLLLQETGPNCGPCVRMARFLDSTRDYWADDFIWLQLDDRWPGTTEITTQLRNNESSSIPWYGLLDSNQKLLFTSCDQDGKNAGFSGSGQSRSHFRKMLEHHASQMTKDRINAMLQELDK